MLRDGFCNLRSMMNVRFLGTGTSQGVPVIACDCEVCTSADQRDVRLRSSIFINNEDTHFVIDTGPDFRAQMLNNHIQQLDAIVYTHEHKDHIAGMDDIRAFNFKQRKDMEVYASPQVQVALQREFHYVFADYKYPGIPEVNLNTIGSDPFMVGSFEVVPIVVMHYKMPVNAYRVHDFTYITDAKTIAPEEIEKIRGSKTIVVNALRKEEHISHFNLAQAIEFLKAMNPERGLLTHISHLMGKHQVVSNDLPAGIEIAYDGLLLELN